MKKTINQRCKYINIILHRGGLDYKFETVMDAADALGVSKTIVYNNINKNTEFVGYTVTADLNIPKL